MRHRGWCSVVHEPSQANESGGVFGRHSGHIVFEPNGEHVGLAIELKAKRGRVSAQKDAIRRLNDRVGAHWFVPVSTNARRFCGSILGGRFRFFRKKRFRVVCFVNCVYFYHMSNTIQHNMFQQTFTDGTGARDVYTFQMINGNAVKFHGSVSSRSSLFNAKAMADKYGVGIVPIDKRTYRNGGCVIFHCVCHRSIHDDSKPRVCTQTSIVKKRGAPSRKQRDVAAVPKKSVHGDAHNTAIEEMASPGSRRSG